MGTTHARRRATWLVGVLMAATIGAVPAIGGDGRASPVPPTPQADIPPVTAEGWTDLAPGTLVEVHDAPPTSHVAGAEEALFVRYTTVDTDGAPALASGLVLLPEPAFRTPGDLPLTLYGHMTTGAADACAPTHGSPDSTELRRMQQGDEVARHLLRAGVVVARPDYEGLGEAGPHPYLRGDSLARSMRDMASAVAGHWDEVGDQWVAAGHSEGAVAALNAGSRLHPPARDLELVGLAAITPVTQIEKLVTALEHVPVTGEGVREAVALAALLLKGLSVVDPAFEQLALRDGGLSDRAVELWPDIERLCLEDLTRPESWGGLAPAQLKGPRGDELVAEFKTAIDEDDVRFLPLRREVPIRIDAGVADLVAHLPYTEQLVAEYRGRGLDVTYQRWPADHSPTADMAAPAISAWITEQFDR